MRAKGLLSVIMTGAMMMGVLSGCGFEPDITWTDTENGSQSTYKVTVVVAHNGTLDIDSEQTVKDGGTLNFVATPSKDGDHRITGLMIDGVKQTIYTGEWPNEDEVKISLENINQDMTVVVLCDNETGGLGGVDGVVTGLDGSGNNDNDDKDDEDKDNPNSTPTTPAVDQHAVSVLARLIDDNDGQEALDGWETVGTDDIMFDDGGKSTTPDDVGTIDFKSIVADNDAGGLTFTIYADRYYEVTTVTAKDSSGQPINREVQPILREIDNDQLIYTYTISQAEVEKADGDIKVEVTYNQLQATMGAGKVQITQDEFENYASIDVSTLYNLKIEFTGTKDNVKFTKLAVNNPEEWTITGSGSDGGGDYIIVQWQQDSSHEPYSQKIYVTLSGDPNAIKKAELKYADEQENFKYEEESAPTVEKLLENLRINTYKNNNEPGQTIEIVEFKDVKVTVTSNDNRATVIDSSDYKLQPGDTHIKVEYNGTVDGVSVDPWEQDITVNPKTVNVTINVTIPDDCNGKVTVTDESGEITTITASTTDPVSVSVESGKSLTIKPTQVTGYDVSVDYNGSETVTNGEHTINPTNDAVIKVTYKKQTYDVTAKVEPGDGGTVSVNGGKLNATVSGYVGKTVTYGDKVTITVTASSNYKIDSATVGMIGGGTVNGPTKTTDSTWTYEIPAVTGHITINAKFKEIIPKVTVSIEGAGSGTVSISSTNTNEFTHSGTGVTSGSVNVPYDQKVTITVTPGKYSKVDKAMVGSNLMTGSNSYTIENVTGDTTVNVSFSKVQLEMEGTIRKTYYLYDGDEDEFDLDDITDLGVKIQGTTTDVTSDGSFTIVSPDGGAFTADDIKTDTHQPTVTIKWTSKDGSISCTGTFDVTVYAMNNDPESKTADKLKEQFLTSVEGKYDHDRPYTSVIVGRGGPDIEEPMMAAPSTDGVIKDTRVGSFVSTKGNKFDFIKRTVTITSEEEALEAFADFKEDVVAPTIKDGTRFPEIVGTTYGYLCIQIEPETGVCTMAMAYNPVIWYY